MSIQEVRDLSHSDVRSLLDGITVNTAAYGRKGDSAQVMLHGKLQRGAIAAGKQFRLLMVAATPDRPDSMNDMAGRQVVAPGDLGLAGIAALELPALFKKAWASCTVNRPVNAAAPEQRAVCGIDNGIDVEGCYVCFDYFKHKSSLLSQAHAP
jgi:glyoxylate carboligase